MGWRPSFKLYKSNGSDLLYHLEYVITTNYPQENPSSVQLINLRSSKGIIIPGGNKPYDITMRGILIGTDYTDLQSQISTMKTAIVANTHYVLKIDTSNSAVDTINVMRLTPINFEEGRRVKFQYWNMSLLANSW